MSLTITAVCNVIVISICAAKTPYNMAKKLIEDTAFATEPSVKELRIPPNKII